MCLHPLYIRNPTRRIVRQGGQRLRMSVRCNKCAECQKEIRREWYFRTFQQVQDTLRHGGYVYFDTLTYNNLYVPRLSHYIDIDKYGIKDMMCFSHEHFKLFLKRLRRKLQYHCGNANFKYFLTSEYGLDERFTRRPHYHILFFVSSGVSPITFSRFVSQCWTYGRTDGIPYKDLHYLQKHVYGYSITAQTDTSFRAVTSACNYVAKYVTKSGKYRKKLDAKMDYLSTFVEDIE